MRLAAETWHELPLTTGISDIHNNPFFPAVKRVGPTEARRKKDASSRKCTTQVTVWN